MLQETLHLAASHHSHVSVLSLNVAANETICYIVSIINTVKRFLYYYSFYTLFFV